MNKALGVKLSVDRHVIEEHLHFVSEKIQQHSDNPSAREHYATEVALILEHIQGHWDTGKSIANVRFLPLQDDGLLVAPRSVITNEKFRQWTDPLRPYLVCSKDLHYGIQRCGEELQKCGAHTSLTMDLANNVLLEHFAEGEDISEAADRQLVVTAAYSLLLGFLDKGGRFQTEPPYVLLPSLKWIMRPLKKLVLVDNQDLMKKLADDSHEHEFLLKCESSAVINQAAALDKLPSGLRPTRLSSLYDQEVKHDGEISGSGNELALQISSHFGDDRFVIGIKQILALMEEHDADTREQYLRYMMATRVYTVENLRVQLEGSEEDAGTAGEGSKPYFLEKLEDHLVLYVDAGANVNMVAEVAEYMACAIQEVIGLDMNLLKHLQVGIKETFDI